MKTITGNYKSDDGKDYYYIALNLKTKEYIQIKNAGCTAAAETMAKEYFHVNLGLYSNNEIKLFFHVTESELNLKFIPEKYHKYFQ